MDELSKGKNAFNWSDEETVNAMDEGQRKNLVYKDKYQKKKSTNQYYESLKQVVKSKRDTIKTSPNKGVKKGYETQLTGLEKKEDYLINLDSNENSDDE